MFRVARPTDRLEAVSRMYVDGFGLEELGTFQDHDGFDGAILGYPGANYHIEFTSNRREPAGGAPSTEHLLVFYIGEPDEWASRCDRMVSAGFVEVEPGNPYWKAHARTFADVDAYRVVICNLEWP
jgi:hypothetical protein